MFSKGGGPEAPLAVLLGNFSRQPVCCNVEVPLDVLCSDDQIVLLAPTVAHLHELVEVALSSAPAVDVGHGCGVVAPDRDCLVAPPVYACKETFKNTGQNQQKKPKTPSMHKPFTTSIQTVH